MVVHIVKIALYDKQPIISRIDVAEGEYMVASKKQGGGEDYGGKQEARRRRGLKLPGKDFSISKKSESWWWFQGRCPLKMRIQYDSKSKVLDLFCYFICCIFSITKLH